MPSLTVETKKRGESKGPSKENSGKSPDNDANGRGRQRCVHQFVGRRIEVVGRSRQRQNEQTTIAVLIYRLVLAIKNMARVHASYLRVQGS